MSSLLVWILIAYGITSIINWGSIFDAPREYIKEKYKFLGDLVSCTLCTATWVGFFLSIVLGSISQNYFDSFYVVNVFMDGMLTAGSVWGLNAIIEYFEENRPKEDE